MILILRNMKMQNKCKAVSLRLYELYVREKNDYI